MISSCYAAHVPVFVKYLTIGTLGICIAAILGCLCGCEPTGTETNVNQSDTNLAETQSDDAAPSSDSESSDDALSDAGQSEVVDFEPEPEPEPEYIDPEILAALEAKSEEQHRMQAEAIAGRKAEWEASQAAQAEAQRAAEQAVIEAREAAASARDPYAHSEGERVNVILPGVGTIIATWTMTDGVWGAWFYTDNYSRIYAYNDAEIGWRLETAEGRIVDYSFESSSEFGQSGPQGLPSNWRDAQDPDIWY
ncbi:MAG: hypothetical protein IKE43_07650 [Coriobacteriales bacterium]|nr:hypothetical protein [Coriobacteriales bacterium]